MNGLFQATRAAILLAIVASCHGGGKKTIPAPVESHASQALAFALIDIGIGNPVSGAADQAVFMLGSGYASATPSVFETPTLLRTVVPPGIVGGSNGFTSGSASLNVIRKKGGLTAASSPKDFFISQIAGGSTLPDGAVSMLAVQALEGLVIHGMGDLWLLDASAVSPLAIGEVLREGPQQIIGLDELWMLVQRVENGETVLLGFFGGQTVILDQSSLPHMDRLVGMLNASLAFELGTVPPDPFDLEGFYRALGHDFTADAEDSALVAGGATRVCMELFEDALLADGVERAQFDPSVLGSIAWFNAFENALTSALYLDALGAEAGIGMSPFTLYGETVADMVPYVTDVAFDHFVAGPFGPAYGATLEAAGASFVIGLASDATLKSELATAFSVGLIGPGSLPPPEFTFDPQWITVSAGPTEYTVTVTTNPPAPDEVIGIRTVGSDGAISVFDATTDASGVATFPSISNGVSGAFDIVHIINPEAGGFESQTSIIVFFP